MTGPIFGRAAPNSTPRFRENLPFSEPSLPTILELPQIASLKSFLSGWTGGSDQEWLLGLVRAVESGKQ